jgi:alpha-aminoadipic semialdehyde synthase
LETLVNGGDKAITMQKLAESLNLDLSSATSSAEANRLIEAFQWLGVNLKHGAGSELVFADADKAISAETKATPLDTFCALLEEKLAYGPTERDMVCMHHVFGIERKVGGRSIPETHTASFICYGEPGGYTAMAKTVALPAAVAAHHLLKGTTVLYSNHIHLTSF